MSPDGCSISCVTMRLKCFWFGWCVHLWAQGGLPWKSATDRRHKFRYAECAWTTFIHGGALTCGRL